ncbi:helix-turn-helix domain-containing protein [Lawsonia intracellularis]|uniref:NA n=2 Tax=Lawsonia intracellularis TaxID=29546 RepID=Q1MNV0_LAWIP|nr:helix-turn-helix transcriptional regulator [Lawsonia intracellularis]KAA0204194.1 XRE family transcriptional regulator [Lawsonia intracellularis]MBZ3893258.1 helix-turn-helix domain-containing protein [Lawsonia intracellularis]OMQ01618.1 transcriptional regulator [Lawsonia intracellularis]RBN31985.1 XRE family transcriptional regulator [Lawsonia intracellularis]RBN32759.1 XRE family transcriptional regulator [Lawsonia intracellularis]
MDRELIKKVLGLIIKNFREEQGLSRYIVAKESGLDSSWLRRLEDGKSGIRTETLILIARGLKLPAATIITKIEQALENPDAWLANYRTTSDSI